MSHEYSRRLSEASKGTELRYFTMGKEAFAVMDIFEKL